MKSIPYGKQYIDEDDIKAVTEALGQELITQGEKVDEFERVIADYHNCRYAVAFCNGTAALHAAYYASGIKEKEEFITTPITFAASANAGLYVGAIPKFVDISPLDYNLDIEKLKSCITEKTKVITPVSFAGYPINLEAIYSLIKDKGIVIIHDAAHAIGAKRNHHTISDFADMTMVSLHPVKHVTTGEGGLILTNNKKYYEKLLIFRSHGITKNKVEINDYEGPWFYDMKELGYNYRLTDIQCALGISQMKKLDKSLYERNRIALRYDEELKELDWITTPENYFDRSWVKKNNELPKDIEDLNSYHLYPILLDKHVDRKEFFEYLRENNIFAQVHYIPVHTLEYYQKNFGFRYGDYPIAEDFYSREISLPMFPTLTDEEQSYVIDTIKNYINSTADNYISRNKRKVEIMF